MSRMRHFYYNFKTVGLFYWLLVKPRCCHLLKLEIKRVEKLLKIEEMGKSWNLYIICEGFLSLRKGKRKVFVVSPPRNSNRSIFQVFRVEYMNFMNLWFLFNHSVAHSHAPLSLSGEFKPAYSVEEQIGFT